jgi:hypothetical protein
MPWSYTNIDILKDLLNVTTYEPIPLDTIYQDSSDEEDYIDIDIEDKEEREKNFPTILLLELPFIPINHIMSVPP